jgi:alpha-ribazole phosphatase
VPDRLRIHLIRHPKPAVASGVCYGQTDVGLLADAESAAEDLRRHLPQHFGLISSPLQRCRQLAEALTADVPTDARLKEMHFGDWENRLWDDIPRADLDAWAAAPFDYTPPGGESAATMATRVIAFATQLASAPTHPDADLVVVSHQGPLRVLMAHWLDLPRESWLKLPLDFAASTCIELSRQGNRLLWLNR